MNESNAQSPDDVAQNSPLRVLVVDDTDANREFMAAFFQHLPHEVEFAKDGNEGVKSALEHEVDVVFMDVQMPGMDGLEATRAIRKHRDEKSLPIVGLSGLGEQDDIQQCLAAGMNDFITKPVRFRRIVEVLEQYRRNGDETGIRGDTDNEIGES